MRRIIIFLVSLFALSGSVVAALATQSYRDWYLRGYVDPTHDQNLPYRVPRLGVNTSLEQYSPDELQTQLDLMESANIVWVRQIISWESIEREPGEYDWSTWDAIVEAVDERKQLKLIAVLYDAPEWARTKIASAEPTAPPQSPDEFATFAAVFAQRYGLFIDHYQIWDEPNLREAWGYLEPRPAEYAALLEAAYHAVHSVDVDATVITAALAPTTETGPNNISDWLYLDDLYSLGAAEFMDAVAAKPYGFDRSPLDREVDISVLNFSRMVRLREIMVENGDGNKAIWASNWGWNALPADWQGNPSIWGEVDIQTQRQYVLDALNRVEREFPWIAGMTLHHWQPIADVDDPMWGFALVNQQNQPTALLEALQNRSVPSLATNGIYSPENPYSQYNGVWTFGNLGADIGWLKDSQLSFEFEGQDVALLVRRGDFVAYLYPTIDGETANAIPRDVAGNPYVVLTSPNREPEVDLLPVGTGLSPGQHTLHAIADRGWDQWILVGYAVSDGNLITPYNQQIAIAWATAGIALLSVIVSSRNLYWSTWLSSFKRIWLSLNDLVQLLIGLLVSGVLLLGMFLTWGDGTPAIFRRDTIVLIISIATTGLIYIEPPLLVTLIAAIVLFIIFVNRIEIGLVLTLAWMPFFLFPVQLYTFFFPMAEILLLLTFTAWSTGKIISWAKQCKVNDAYTIKLSVIRLNSTDIGIILFFVSACLTLFWTEYYDPAITELRTLIIEPILFYIVLRTSVKNSETILWLVDALLIAGLAASIIGLGMYINGVGIITAEGGAQRLSGIYGSPNNVALLLGRAIPFALAYSLIGFHRIRRWLGITVLICAAPTLALTQSAGWIVYWRSHLCCHCIAAHFETSSSFTLTAFAVLGGIGTTILLRFPRFSRLLDFSSGTNFFRLRVWQSGINVIQDYPLTGLGLDQFLYAFRGRYIFPDAWQEPDLSHPHNFILDFWIRLGLLGLITFLWIQVTFWRRMVRLYRDLNPQSWDFAIWVGTVGAMINLLAHGMIDNSVFVNDLVLIFILLVAMPQLLKKFQTKSNSAISCIPGRHDLWYTARRFD